MPAPGTGRPRADPLGLLGLARRAGAVIPGVDGVRRAVKGGEAELVVLARDAAEGQLRKVRGVLRHNPVPACWAPDRASLGRAVGAAPISAVAVTVRTFAEPLERALPRMGKMPPGGEGESGFDAGS